jgi:hypothetical protein
LLVMCCIAAPLSGCAMNRTEIGSPAWPHIPRAVPGAERRVYISGFYEFETATRRAQRPRCPAL